MIGERIFLSRTVKRRKFPYQYFLYRRADKLLSMDSKPNGEYKVSKLSFGDAEESPVGKLPDASQKVYIFEKFRCRFLKEQLPSVAHSLLDLQKIHFV